MNYFTGFLKCHSLVIGIFLMFALTWPIDLARIRTAALTGKAQRSCIEPGRGCDLGTLASPQAFVALGHHYVCVFHGCDHGKGSFVHLAL